MIIEAFYNGKRAGFLALGDVLDHRDKNVHSLIKLSSEVDSHWLLVPETAGNVRIEHPDGEGATLYLDTYDEREETPVVLYRRRTMSRFQRFSVVEGKINTNGCYLAIFRRQLCTGKDSGWTFYITETPKPTIRQLEHMMSFDHFLGLYTYKFMSDVSANLNKLALTSGKNDECFFIKSNSTVSDDLIKKSLKYRYPVYYGEIMKGNYKETELQLHHGYSTKDVSKVITPTIDAEARFGICGPVLGLSDSTIREDVWVLHVWGINFESTSTADYAAMLRDGWDMKAYYKRCNELYMSILKTATHINEITGRFVCIKAPGIGLGAFMSAVSDEHMKERMREQHALAIQNVFSRSNNNYAFYYSDYEWLGSSKLENHAYPDTELFEIPSSRNDRIYLLVNAWDNRSFIGNGGSQDRSIDGYMVSGLGRGSSFPNSSYTHNPFFAKHLYDSQHWLRLE